MLRTCPCSVTTLSAEIAAALGTLPTGSAGVRRRDDACSISSRADPSRRAPACPPTSARREASRSAGRPCARRSPHSRSSASSMCGPDRARTCAARSSELLPQSLQLGRAPRRAATPPSCSNCAQGLEIYVARLAAERAHEGTAREPCAVTPRTPCATPHRTTSESFVKSRPRRSTTARERRPRNRLLARPAPGRAVAPPACGSTAPCRTRATRAPHSRSMRPSTVRSPHARATPPPRRWRRTWRPLRPGSRPPARTMPLRAASPRARPDATRASAPRHPVVRVTRFEVAARDGRPISPRRVECRHLVRVGREVVAGTVVAHDEGHGSLGQVGHEHTPGTVGPHGADELHVLGEEGFRHEQPPAAELGDGRDRGGHGERAARVADAAGPGCLEVVHRGDLAVLGGGADRRVARDRPGGEGLRGLARVGRAGHELRAVAVGERRRACPGAARSSRRR